jgi:superoxide dismutase, Fe-Mn family
LGEQTLRIHHDKHHAKYVTTTNSMIAGTEMEKDDVVTILRKAYGKNQPLFNNAAQSYNHAFYWDCMKVGKRVLSDETCDASAQSTFDKIFCGPI